jgi:hypothetical protein
MGGYLSFKSSGLLFPRLTEQHPFTRLPHGIRLLVFVEAHRETSKCLNWLYAAGEPKHGFCNKLRRVIRLDAPNGGLDPYAALCGPCKAIL